MGGAYTKKDGQGNGVIAMIDLLVKDLDKEMQEADVMEKDAQAGYEKMLADASEKRAADAKSINEKEGAKAETEGNLQDENVKKVATTQNAMGVAKYIGSLHSECDWLLRYFEARKTTRADESDSLVNAKAVLNGADFALLQTVAASRPAHFLAARMQ